jgi:hypothetical protein
MTSRSAGWSDYILYDFKNIFWMKESIFLILGYFLQYLYFLIAAQGDKNERSLHMTRVVNQLITGHRVILSLLILSA